jgi:hypothetical protein
MLSLVISIRANRCKASIKTGQLRLMLLIKKQLRSAFLSSNQVAVAAKWKNLMPF